VSSGDDSVFDVIRAHSQDADVVFMGLTVPQIGQEQEYCQRLTQMVQGLPTTILVRNSGPFSGKLI
jgi:hypothetical protein